MLKFPFCLKMVQSGDIYIRDEMIEKGRRMWNRFICLTDEAVLSSIILVFHLKSSLNRHNIFITNGYPDRKKEMRARIYNRKEKRYYISEIYGILNCGMEICLADDIDDSETVVLVEYSDFSSGAPYEIFIEKVDINTPPQFQWIYIGKEEMEGVNSAIGMPGKYHYFQGYDFVWDRKDVLAELLMKGRIAKNRWKAGLVSTKLSGWNYIECQEDIDRLMGEFSGFHDSVLKEFSYITGDYISSEGHMCLSESGSKQIKIIFESDWAKPIEMILLAPKFIQLVPPAENYLANLFDASIFIKDCMVYFYDSYMESIPSQYNGSYFSAMGMRWRHYCV